MQWIGAAALGLALAAAQPSAWAQTTTSSQSTSTPAAASSAGDSSRGLVLSPTSTSTGTGSSSGAMGGLVSTTSSQTGSAVTGSSSTQWSAAETAAYQDAVNTVNDYVNSTTNSYTVQQASSAGLRLALQYPVSADVVNTLATSIDNAQNNLATAQSIYLGAVAAVQLQNQGYAQAANRVALDNVTMTASQAAAYLSTAKAQLDQAQQAYNDAWTTFQAQTGVSQADALAVSSQNLGDTIQNHTSDQATTFVYPSTGASSWQITGLGVSAGGDQSLINQAARDAAQAQLNQAYASVANASPAVQEAALNAVLATMPIATANNEEGWHVSVVPSSSNSTQATDTTASTTTASTATASTNSNSADGASVGGQADAAVAQEIEDVLRDAEASIQVITTSADANSDLTGTVAQQASQASQAEQAIADAATAAEAASATIANDSAAMTSDQLEITASEYDATSGDALSVANLEAIYNGYSINQEGSSVIQVTSSQVNVPSTQVNVPSMQIDVPSDQLDMPSGIMTSLDLQPALCGQ
jgi:hypothetical protein